MTNCRCTRLGPEGSDPSISIMDPTYDLRLYPLDIHFAALPPPSFSASAGLKHSLCHFCIVQIKHYIFSSNCLNLTSPRQTTQHMHCSVIQTPLKSFKISSAYTLHVETVNEKSYHSCTLLNAEIGHQYAYFPLPCLVLNIFLAYVQRVSIYVFNVPHFRRRPGVSPAPRARPRLRTPS